ncbi:MULTISPECIES: hypothetical protein [Caballeronia]|uniref:Uncharacterized protein n=1 Tax=Caballeronia jiangsuensis TaxID=1458357 RepID=A0ABW9CVA9_9BURK|nr:hypothetical protein [Caballeronia sp. GaOx3]
MDFEAWMDFFGTSQDDLSLNAALAAAGVRKVPKLDEESTSVQFALKGHGLELIMTDEATLKALDDQDVGEGPLILSGVLAKFGASERDPYRGSLPFGIAADMSQDSLRKLLGKPTETETKPPSDVWIGKQREISVRYAKDCQSLTRLSVRLPGVEF